MLNKKGRISEASDRLMMANAAFFVTPQVTVNPVQTNHHLQGSVKYTKKGIHDARSVIPEASAYIFKKPGNVTFLPMVVTMTIYPKKAVIKTIPTALTKKIPPISIRSK